MIKKTSSNFLAIVAILGDGHYHTGEAIGEALQITRSAVWKVIKKLQNYGVKIDSIKGKGYALQEPLVLLDMNEIKSKLTNKKLSIALFESVDSTNDYFKSVKQSQKHPICLAEQQTKGKGRLGRAWFSPFAQNIYLSCLYPFQKDISELAGLSLVITLAMINVLRKHGVDAAAKWPNDIVVDGKKLSGTLIEVQAESHGTSRAIIGIGVNVNMLSDQQEISQAWVSMRKLTGQYHDRNELCADLINELLVYLEKFAAQGFKVFIQEWIGADYLTGQAVAIKNFGESVTGKVVGVNEQGHLLLRLQDGKTQAFSAGDTTLVKSDHGLC